MLVEGHVEVYSSIGRERKFAHIVAFVAQDDGDINGLEAVVLTGLLVVKSLAGGSITDSATYSNAIDGNHGKT